MMIHVGITSLKDQISQRIAQRNSFLSIAFGNLSIRVRKKHATVCDHMSVCVWLSDAHDQDVACRSPLGLDWVFMQLAYRVAVVTSDKNGDDLHDVIRFCI